MLDSDARCADKKNAGGGEEMTWGIVVTVAARWKARTGPRPASATKRIMTAVTMRAKSRESRSRSG